MGLYHTTILCLYCTSYIRSVFNVQLESRFLYSLVDRGIIKQFPTSQRQAIYAPYNKIATNSSTHMGVDSIRRCEELRPSGRGTQRRRKHQANKVTEASVRSKPVIIDRIVTGPGSSQRASRFTKHGKLRCDKMPPESYEVDTSCYVGTVCIQGKQVFVVAQ